jgi:hypothetical protein
MNLLTLLRIVVVIATFLTGLAALFWPRAIQGFIGLTAPGGRGITEIRSIFGGLFIGLSLAILLLNTPEVYKLLGITYGAIGTVRAISMVVDKSVEQSNVISLIVEIIFAVILVV